VLAREHAVRSIIAGPASVAVTAKPRSASPTASWPVPARAVQDAPARGHLRERRREAEALPAGASSASGTSQS
jgi:hypothetical protein